jgi:ribosome-associated protein
MKQRGEGLLGEEGLSFGHWVLLDYGDFVVHLFDPEHRRIYDLELLWGDARKVAWKRPKRASPGSELLFSSPG